MCDNAKDVPKYGFKVKLNHEFPERWLQKIKPKLKNVIQHLPLVWRYV